MKNKKASEKSKAFLFFKNLMFTHFSGNKNLFVCTSMSTQSVRA